MIVCRLGWHGGTMVLGSPRDPGVQDSNRRPAANEAVSSTFGTTSRLA